MGLVIVVAAVPWISIGLPFREASSYSSLSAPERRTPTSLALTRPQDASQGACVARSAVEHAAAVNNDFRADRPT